MYCFSISRRSFVFGGGGSFCCADNVSGAVGCFFAVLGVKNFLSTRFEVVKNVLTNDLRWFWGFCIDFWRRI